MRSSPYLILVLLPFLAGCVCDPQIERLASKGPAATKNVAVATRKDQTAIGEARRPSSKTTLKIIRLKSCDCPEDFDPQVCGDRRAYTWSQTCPSATVAPVLKYPSSLKGPVPPSESLQPH